MEWHYPDSSRKKLKAVCPTEKLMVTMFGEQKRAILLPNGTNINNDFNVSTLSKHITLLLQVTFENELGAFAT